MAPLALAIGQPADGQQIGRLEQPHAVARDRGERRRPACRRCRETGAASGMQASTHATRRCAPRPTKLPKICMRSDRARGPSSSAMRMRCHWPSTTSPPLTCSVRLCPSSSARRCESAFIRSQSECSGSLCSHSASRATICSRNRLMSVSSAVWNSLMKSVQVVCIDHRLTSPSRILKRLTNSMTRLGQIDELDPLIGLHDDRFAMNGEAAHMSPKPPLRQASREP